MIKMISYVFTDGQMSRDRHIETIDSLNTLYGSGRVRQSEKYTRDGWYAQHLRGIYSGSYTVGIPREGAEGWIGSLHSTILSGRQSLVSGRSALTYDDVLQTLSGESSRIVCTDWDAFKVLIQTTDYEALDSFKKHGETFMPKEYEATLKRAKKYLNIFYI